MNDLLCMSPSGWDIYMMWAGEGGVLKEALTLPLTIKNEKKMAKAGLQIRGTVIHCRMTISKLANRMQSQSLIN